MGLDGFPWGVQWVRWYLMRILGLILTYLLNTLPILLHNANTVPSMSGPGPHIAHASMYRSYSRLLGGHIVAGTKKLTPFS